MLDMPRLCEGLGEGGEGGGVAGQARFVDMTALGIVCAVDERELRSGERRGGPSFGLFLVEDVAGVKEQAAPATTVFTFEGKRRDQTAPSCLTLRRPHRFKNRLGSAHRRSLVLIPKPGRSRVKLGTMARLTELSLHLNTSVQLARPLPSPACGRRDLS